MCRLMRRTPSPYGRLLSMIEISSCEASFQNAGVLGFPPYVRMVNIIAWGRDLQHVKRVIQQIYDTLESKIFECDKTQWVLLPPSPCAFEKIRNDFRWHCIFKVPHDEDVSAFLNEVFDKRQADKFVNVAIDVDPLDLL